jgi:EpsI family protein
LLNFLKSTPAKVITLLLLVQCVVLYSSNRQENVPPNTPLAQMPHTLGGWQFGREGVVDQETMDVLKADDVLNRDYVNRAYNRAANLFVAAFRSQKTGKAPHSPKNCLPGSGWTPLRSDFYDISIPGQAPITVNRYVVEHGNDRSVVLYWYQSRERVVASEYKAKFWVMADALRLNRTDTALVRVVVRIDNQDTEQATGIAEDFVRSFFQPLHSYLPA